MRASKSMRMKKWLETAISAVKDPSWIKNPAHRTWVLGGGAVAVGVVGLVIAAAMTGRSDSTAQSNAPAEAHAKAMAGLPAKTVDATDPQGASSDDKDKKKPAIVTITGCLERNDEGFRLKDTTGNDAPKSRSWKSGFLKKKADAIEVVDGGNRLKLTSYVGQRVSLTGRLVDREMQARSLQRVSSSCKAPKA